MTTLTATGSTGNTYAWVCTGDPPATLANTDQNALTFTAPVVDANVQYTCIVTATGDGTHALSTTATASATVTVTNIDTTAPSFGGLSITNKVYTQDEEITAVVLPAATDAVSTTEASLTYQLLGLPIGLTFEESTRMLSGRPINAQSATEYSYTATDEAGNRSAELTFTITVNPNAAPTVTIAPGSVTVGEGEMTTLTATGSTGNTYAWVCTGDPPATLANTDQNALTFTAPVVDANVQYTCIVTATGDGTHALSTTATASATVTVTNIDTTAPSFGGLVITNKVYTQGEEITAVVLPAATDAVSTTEVSLTYQLSGLPTGLTFEESTRRLSGRPINAQSATECSYTATDEAGNRSVGLTFTISVLDTTAPSFGANIANQVYTQDEEITAVVLPAATDAVSTTEVSLTYELSGLPTGLTFEESTRTISGTPTSAQLAIEYSYTATDEAGNTSVGLTFMITVNPHAAPTVTITEGSSVTVDEGEMTTLTATGSMGNTYAWACTGTPTATLANADQNALTFTAPTVDANVEYICMVTATGDGTHATSTTATASATVTVTNTDTTDTTDPILDPTSSALISDRTFTLTVGIPIEMSLQLPEATDEGAVIYSLAPALPAGLSFNVDTRAISGTPVAMQDAITYTYTASDAVGNIASLTFMIAIEAAPLGIVDQPAGFGLYPNPSSNLLTLWIENDFRGMLRICVRDLSGKEVVSFTKEKRTSRLEIPLDLDESGIFLVEVQAGKQVWLEKVVREE